MKVMKRKESLLLVFACCGLLFGLTLDPIRQAWAHLRLAARLHAPLDASVFVVSMPEIQGVGSIICGKGVLLADELYFDTQQTGNIAIDDHAVFDVVERGQAGRGRARRDAARDRRPPARA